METKPIRVLIADDHEVICEAVSLYLEKDPDFQVVKKIYSGAETLRVSLEEKPEVLLLDLRLPDLDGLQVLAALQTADSPPQVVVLTAYPTPENLTEAIAIGASAFISKDIALHQIPQVIRAVVSGKSVVQSPSLGLTFQSEDQIDFEKIKSTSISAVDLGDYHFELLRLLSEGLSTPEIASRLSEPERAIKDMISELYEKINVRSRTEAVIWAANQGLI